MKRDPDPPTESPTDDNPDTDEWIPDDLRDDGPASSRDMG